MVLFASWSRVWSKNGRWLKAFFTHSDDYHKVDFILVCLYYIKLIFGRSKHLEKCNNKLIKITTMRKITNIRLLWRPLKYQESFKTNLKTNLTTDFKTDLKTDFKTDLKTDLTTDLKTDLTTDIKTDLTTDA